MTVPSGDADRNRNSSGSMRRRWRRSSSKRIVHNAYRRLELDGPSMRKLKAADPIKDAGDANSAPESKPAKGGKK